MTGATHAQAWAAHAEPRIALIRPCPLWPRTTEVAESNNQEMLAGVDLTQRVYFKGRGTLRQAESS